MSILIKLFKDFLKGKDWIKMIKNAKDWDDISIILYEGSKEEIEKLKCPICGGKISYSFNLEVGSNMIKCNGSCGMVSRGHNDIDDIPNCVKYFGEVNIIE